MSDECKIGREEELRAALQNLLQRVGALLYIAGMSVIAVLSALMMLLQSSVQPWGWLFLGVAVALLTAGVVCDWRAICVYAASDSGEEA